MCKFYKQQLRLADAAASLEVPKELFFDFKVLIMVFGGRGDGVVENAGTRNCSERR